MLSVLWSLPGAGGLAEKIDEAGVIRKVNRHLLTRFVMLTVMCYLVRDSPSLLLICLSGFRSRSQGSLWHTIDRS